MIGTIFRAMMKAGFDTAEIASICNHSPDLFPGFYGAGTEQGRPMPVCESDVWNQIARVDHLDLTGAA